MRYVLGFIFSMFMFSGVFAQNDMGQNPDTASAGVEDTGSVRAEEFPFQGDTLPDDPYSFGEEDTLGTDQEYQYEYETDDSELKVKKDDEGEAKVKYEDDEVEYKEKIDEPEGDAGIRERKIKFEDDESEVKFKTDEE